MTDKHSEQWRMHIIFSIACQERQPVTKQTPDGEEFALLVLHLEGDGLIQIAHRLPEGMDQRFYRFDRYGGLKGVFDLQADGSDSLVYDRDSGFGWKHRRKTESNCSEMIARLETTLVQEEEMAFYL